MTLHLSEDRVSGLPLCTSNVWSHLKQPLKTLKKSLIKTLTNLILNALTDHYLCQVEPESILQEPESYTQSCEFRVTPVPSVFSNLGLHWVWDWDWVQGDQTWDQGLTIITIDFIRPFFEKFIHEKLMCNIIRFFFFKMLVSSSKQST